MLAALGEVPEHHHPIRGPFLLIGLTWLISPRIQKHGSISEVSNPPYEAAPVYLNATEPIGG